MIKVSKSTLIGIGINAVLGVLLIYMLYIKQDAFFYKDRLSRPAPFRVAFVEMEAIESAALVQKGIIDHTKQASGLPLIDLHIFDANNDKIRLHALMEKAIEEQFDVIVPFGSMVTQLAQELTSKRNSSKPIVFCGIGDPAKIGIIGADGKAPANITGFGVSGFGFVKPMIEQLPLLAPWVKKILIPYNPTSLGGTLEEYYQLFEKELTAKGYSVTNVKIYESNEVCPKIKSFISDTDMVWVLPDATVLEVMDGVAKLCERYQKPSYCTMNLNRLSHGAAIAFGYSLYEVGLDVGDYIRQILENGKKPSELPIMPLQAERFRIGINVENAKAQGLIKRLDPAIAYFMEHGVIFEQPL